MEVRRTLPVWQFGQRLIETGDLDPVYVAVVGARMPTPQLERWLLAYWCYYHVGASSWLSEQEGDDYWRWMKRAAGNTLPPPGSTTPDRWPRAAERRHFRGDKCVAAIDYLWREYDLPEHPVRSLRGLSDADAVMSSVTGWPMFGPWIAFKAADMMERCAGERVDFPDDLGLIYEEPRSALDILSDEATHSGNDKLPTTPDAWWQTLREKFAHTTAPPASSRLRRNVSVQEVETILCKWKSHSRGRYAVGKDTREIRHALQGWGATAEKMLAAAPEEVTE